MLMSADVVAAFNAALADPNGGWSFSSVHEEIHSELHLNGSNDLVEHQTRRVTMALENALQGKMLICFLEGPASPPASKLSIVLNGTKMETTNATLITRFENAIPILSGLVQTAAVGFFEGA